MMAGKGPGRDSERKGAGAENRQEISGQHGVWAKIKRIMTSPAAAVVMFAAAVLLLLGSSVGGARAALTYFSETYASRVQMYDIGVSLLENDERVSWRDYRSNADGTWDEHTGVLLGNMLAEGESLQPGKTYPEALSVRNSGTINQYVRVSIYKYWLDAEGKKMQELSPDLIDLHLLCDATGVDNGWLLDAEASTPERTVLYYDSLLYSEGAGTFETPAFSDTLTIDGMLATKVSQETKTENGLTTITTTYDYDGVSFHIEAEVDAVQEHNAADAAWSAWGRRVNVNDGTLSLE